MFDNNKKRKYSLQNPRVLNWFMKTKSHTNALNVIKVVKPTKHYLDYQKKPFECSLCDSSVHEGKKANFKDSIQFFLIGIIILTSLG